MDQEDRVKQLFNLAHSDYHNGENPPETKTWPEIISCKEFLSMSILQPVNVVENILDSGSRLIFGGGAKTYKTWAMSDLALSVAAGAPWWGFETKTVPQLYVNFEVERFYMQQRWRAIVEARKLPFGPLFIFNLKNVPIGSLLEFKEALLREIDRDKIQQVYIDPFYKMLCGRDERASVDINQILEIFDEITLKTGSGFIFAAHFTKGNQASKESIDRVSGGGSINRDPDNLITLTRHEIDGCFIVEFTNRNFKPISPFVVEWQYPLLVKRPDLDPENFKIPKLPKSSSDPLCDEEELLLLIKAKNGELTKPTLFKEVNSQLGWSQKTFYRKMDSLHAKHKIECSPVDKTWSVSVSVFNRS
jgi:AAA domain-containing protein